MSFQSSNDIKPETAPAPAADLDNLTNLPLVFAAKPLPDAVLIEAIWTATHVPQNRRLIASIRERKS
jgi:hypothetical protein